MLYPFTCSISVTGTDTHRTYHTVRSSSSTHGHIPRRYGTLKRSHEFRVSPLTFIRPLRVIMSASTPPSIISHASQHFCLLSQRDILRRSLLGSRSALTITAHHEEGFNFYLWPFAARGFRNPTSAGLRIWQRPQTRDREGLAFP